MQGAASPRGPVYRPPLAGITPIVDAWRVLAVGDSVWELLAILFIVLVPTVPVTYFAWSFVSSRRTAQRGETQEIESGRSPATPFAVISVVGTAIAAAAVLTLLLVIAVRALVA